MTKVFVTGGSGLVGSSVIPALVAAGHTVTALARSPDNTSKLQAMGAQTVAGDLENLQVMHDACINADAAIHLAFNHEIAFTGDYPKAAEMDRAAIKTMCDALLEGSKGETRTFINTSGTLGLVGSDEMSDNIKNEAFPRYKSEELTMSYASKALRSFNVRLPPIVHGPAKEHPFITAPINTAKKVGYSPYVGEGQNHWSACHVEDAAQLYVLALDKPAQGGVALHAIGEEAISTKEIAEFIAKKLGVPTKSITSEEAQESMGFVGFIFGMGHGVIAKHTREWTGWQPTHPGLFDTVDKYNF